MSNHILRNQAILTEHGVHCAIVEGRLLTFDDPVLVEDVTDLSLPELLLFLGYCPGQIELYTS